VVRQNVILRGIKALSAWPTSAADHFGFVVWRLAKPSAAPQKKSLGAAKPPPNHQVFGMTYVAASL
jgi:hypothetical protein